MITMAGTLEKVLERAQSMGLRETLVLVERYQGTKVAVTASCEDPRGNDRPEHVEVFRQCHDRSIDADVLAAADRCCQVLESKISTRN